MDPGVGPHGPAQTTEIDVNRSAVFRRVFFKKTLTLTFVLVPQHVLTTGTGVIAYASGEVAFSWGFNGIFH